ncbi:unknown [Mycoplasma sp. CAG:776]|nr:unknown [Mycoplasma sp. CAG:776]
MYRKFSRDEYKKSLAYITRLYSNQYDRGKKYKEGRKVIGINIIENNYQKTIHF